MAPHDRSGLVLLYLGSAALQELPPTERWSLASVRAGRPIPEFAGDRVLPLMIWYGIEPAVVEDLHVPCGWSSRARCSLWSASCVARRLTENLKLVPHPWQIERLVTLAGPASGIRSGQSERFSPEWPSQLRGWRKAPMPAVVEVRTRERILEPSPDPDVRRLARELSVVFGDGRALNDLARIARSNGADPGGRRDAVRVLVEARAPGLEPLLRQLIDERDLGPDAARGLAVFDDPQLPRFLFAQFAKLKEPTRDAVVVTLCARPASARLLLADVASGTIDRSRIPAFQVRQMAGFSDVEVRRQVSKLWPELKTISAAKRTRIDQLKSRLAPAVLSAADRVQGRRRFAQTCATCHTLFGQGGKIGPDLTGSQRSNIDYLLENIIDPSAIVQPAYKMSTIALADGRVLNGIVVEQSGPTLTVQTPTERLTLNRADVEEVRKSNLSLMPEGLLDVLPEQEIRDLFAYLMSPQQVSLGTPPSAHGEPSASRTSP